MPTSLRLVHHAGEEWLRDFESAISRIDIREPSTWLTKEHELEEKMLQDADIRHAVDHRTALVAGREFSIVPKRENSSDLSKLAVDVANDCLEELEQFAEARKRLARVFLHGQCYEVIKMAPFRLPIGDGKPRLWHLPVASEHREKWMYRKTIDDRKSANPKATWKRWAFYGPEAGLWKEMSQADSDALIKHVYADEMGGLGYGRPLRDALALVWYAKTHTHRETLGAIERFARGLPMLKIDGLRDGASNKYNSAVQTDALKVLKKMMARHELVIDKTDDLEIVEGSGTGHEMLSDFRRELKEAVFTLVLSANLPTGASEGGSYAMADVQEGSTEILVQFDRQSLEETLSRHLLGYIWKCNWANMCALGIQNERPKFDLMQERREDPEVAMRVLTMMNAVGLPVKLDEAYKRTPYSRPGKDDEVLEGAQPQPMGGMGMPGFGPPPQNGSPFPSMPNPFGQPEDEATRGMPTPGTMRP